eukprot:5807304-Pleurochrysis_carterae.AAC.2
MPDNAPPSRERKAELGAIAPAPAAGSAAHLPPPQGAFHVTHTPAVAALLQRIRHMPPPPWATWSASPARSAGACSACSARSTPSRPDPAPG